MKSQEDITYQRVAEALSYLQENFKKQPNLNEIAEEASLSPFHFQRIFTEWAGVSPKKFLQFISLGHAKKILRETNTNLLEASMEAGLSGTGRLHDLFVNIEGMTPGEYKNGGTNLQINYSFSGTPFGEILVASTSKGICYLAFLEDEPYTIEGLVSRFPNASFKNREDQLQQNALRIFQQDWTKMDQIKLHLKGSDFQLKVWESLLKIPMGKLTTYGQIAEKINNPKASRAVGTAIGSNPVAFLIPCHRVIQASGIFGGYMWGPARKTAIIGWEAAMIDKRH
ncbi:methylated-DNA--[protein]-cysteine S-methyltransferase [Echinicola marina]|uniref:bifunctional helix-turn-helix domain-containing protein/methylated-DNA--[protein]-cysteine S-methyltransferase n=1 Tax=Echinicola marina TaxID=2859768 RepID=UPI001CF65E75|nr:methylated-DNA--[protein]-cysteine S-methyltransferase [Echinicola marina]UCS92843.1 methylated-DNA--[protein]-cysteine S-methyltransferase [Echinicola marina]